MTKHKAGPGMENTPTIDQLFPISDEEWLNLRTMVQTSTDVAFIDWITDQLGELEMQVAYTFHVIEQRTADLKP